MKKTFFILILLFFLVQTGFVQDNGKNNGKETEEIYLGKSTGVEDRAGGTHNASNIGLFFENRGKLYPRRLTQGPSGEFPIGTGKHYIYRMNPFVGVPHNVIQGRFTTNEEWEAVAGYHNREYAKIAFSDNPSSWPATGWPVKDANGNPVFKSDQDSYCVYDDFNNTVKYLGVTVAQTGYTYGVKFAQNLIFYKYEITNNGPNDLDSLYFAMYCDIDVGDVSGGTPEYKDDRLDFDKANNFLYFFDDGVSSEWPGGVTGFFGFAILKTPKINDAEAGITDMHYNLYDDDRDEDELQYAVLSSNPDHVVPQTLVEKYFHLGSNADVHFDDPATIPTTGLDVTATVSSGPYFLARGDTLVFYTVIVGGNNKEDLYTSLATAQKIFDFNFEISKPPATPTLAAYAGDGYVTLFWDDAAERSKDNFSGEYDFEGYRVYKSVDRGLHWDQYDRNVDPTVGIDPVPLIGFDMKNQLGLDTGLQYSFTDTTVTNGFEYWYTVTAYDRGGDLVESLESPRGKSTETINIVSVIPKSRALDRIDVSSGEVEYIGTGKSNYVLDVKPIDADSLGERNYTVRFTYLQRTERGTLKTKAVPVISDSSKTEAKNYGFDFISPNSFHLIDISTGDPVEPDPRSYRSGTLYYINAGMKIKIEDPDPNAEAEFLPKAGDYISLNYAVYVVRNQRDTVVSKMPFLLEKPHATSDGVIFKLTPPEMIHSVSRVGGTDNVDITFSISDAAMVENNIYLIFIQSAAVEENLGFVSLLITDAAGDSMIVDSLYNSDSFEFDGVRGEIEFPQTSPPSPGNAFALETVVPKAPNVKDAYRFQIQGATTTTSGQFKNELDRIKVVPNPYIVSSLYEPEFGELRKEPLRQLQFINLPQNCSIYIFTTAGDLIKTIYHESSTGTEFWDLRAEGGREIAPGIYLYVVKTKDLEYLNRFTVIK